MQNIISQLVKEFKIREQQAVNTVKLIDEGNTIPFIARYRKEATGGLDDSILRDFYERLTYLRNLESRKQEIRHLIEEQGRLTDEVLESIQNAQTMTELEDIYRPYRPKRRTRATIAKEKGLEPLSDIIWNQEMQEGSIENIAMAYLDPEKEVDTVEQAISMALDIIAERISDDADYRKYIRDFTFRNGVLEAKAAKEEASVYEMYYEYKEAVSKIVPHRILAINRGENEKFLSVKIVLDEDKIIEDLCMKVIVKPSIGSELIKRAVEDAYKRLIAPSIEREIRNQLTEKAEDQAIRVFGENLRNLLLQPPVKGKIVMGVDPGYRTGNKIALVDDTGKVLDTSVVFMTLPNHNKEQAKSTLKKLIELHHVNIIAIGNGTASRESEIVIAELCREMDRKVQYIIVNEAGASVYSASKLGSEEFPDFDVALRSAVSIARRLQDPLAELVKIDPKSIGVGQYQHDVNQKRLAEALRGVVEDCVNSVGVDLNTASPSLLQYISGITPTLAKNIVAYRQEKGRFLNRQELLNVSKLGPKAFEQCAGFLRIPGGDNILDNTAVHPESYNAVLQLLEMKNLTLKDIEKGGLKRLAEESGKWDLAQLSKELGIGLPTLKDIIRELQKPGRDPRDELPQPILRTDVMDLKDLKPDMILTGTVRNVIDFGVFVDIGVHQDGLVHISQLSDSYVKHPMDVVQVGDIVTVKVLDVDVARKRISLTMRGI
ncbi:MAG TPA: RNA-binding transcriptional accessory protein [Clostridiales bacterium]|nr:RNA-binding transcriptional accessory protein [Clostridiales bacterium]